MKILIVEDNRDIAANIADYFESRGHEMDFADDGLRGRELALDGDHDVIVLDLMLPRLDGLSLCRQLRDQHGLSTPVLMLTARDQLDDKLEGFGAGADDYLVKPFSLPELEVRLNALVRRAAQGHDRELTVADLTFNTDTLEVRRKGQVLDINPTQRRILELLMRQSPGVVSRGQIERQVWQNTPPDNDTLRTHIYALRNVIDKPFDEKLLHTVHGTGYRLARRDTHA